VREHGYIYETNVTTQIYIFTLVILVSSRCICCGIWTV